MTTSPKFPYKTEFGHFSEDGKSYIITRPDTPRPWANVLSTGTYGVALSQTGSGSSWLHHASHNRITRAHHDLLKDEGGRAIYLRDEDSGEFWSVGWQPVRKKPDSYECIHGIGYTIITSQTAGIQAQWMVFVPHEEPLEIWRLRIKNISGKSRRLTLWTYMEWVLGKGCGPCHPEGSFLQTQTRDGGKVILAKNNLSSLKNKNGEFWNRTWDWTAWHGSSFTPKAVCTNRESFLGPYGSLQTPAALLKGHYAPQVTQSDNAAAGVCVTLNLKPREEKSGLFTVGAAESESLAVAKAREFQDFSQVDRAWNKTELFWDQFLSEFTVETPDEGFDALTNIWLKYQALTGGVWARTSHGDAGGGYSFAHHLHVAQVFLSLQPARLREQIRLHAAHQLVDGRVYGHWHPLSETGMPSSNAADLIALPWAVVNYVRETTQWNILSEDVFYAAEPKKNKRQSASIYEHATKAFDVAMANLSPRGLPLCSGGECVKTAHMFYAALIDWADFIERAVTHGALPSKERQKAKKYIVFAKNLKQNINRKCWDGQWYWGGSNAAGQIYGSRKNKEGRIALSAQTWGLLSGVADSKSRRAALEKAIHQNLDSAFGPLTLAPVFAAPDENVGLSSRYARGTCGNAGVKVPNALVALHVECASGRAANAADIYRKLSPVLNAAKNPRRYGAEPYAVPEYIDGPASATPGFARGAWDAGAAAWFYLVNTMGILGVSADWEGLRLHPCLPPEWKEARVKRHFRECVYDIHIIRDPKLARGAQQIFVNGKKISGQVLPVVSGLMASVEVRVGPAAK